MDTIKEAYGIVLNDILNKGCGMFVGKYDASNGSDQFMYGILTVMEHIAYSICDEEGDAFSDFFVKNMVASKQKAQVSSVTNVRSCQVATKDNTAEKNINVFRKKGIDK